MKFAQRFGLVLSLCLAVFAPMANGSGAPKANISVSATPSSRSVASGGAVTYSVSVSTSNLNHTVTMSAAGLPAGASASFSPSSFIVTPASPNKAITLTVSTNSATPSGNSVISIRASAGDNASATTTVSLAVCSYAMSASPTVGSVGAGASVAYSVSLARCSGYTAAPTLSVSGLPSGATATFSSNPVTGSSTTLTVHTTPTTAGGSYTLTITGTGSVSTTVTLTVCSYTLSAAPATGSVSPGTSFAYTVSVARCPGYTSAPTLSVSGLPSGATASFSSNPVIGNSTTLTVLTKSTTPSSAYTLTITGSGGISTTVKLIVCTYTLSATPTTAKVNAGGIALYSVSLARCPGYTTAVSMTVSGLPSGASASYSPNPVTGSSTTLSVSTKATTPSGNFNLTITGTGGISTSVQLSVNQAPVNGSPFTITGNLSGLLAPGVSRALDVTLTNPNSVSLNVNSLSVAVTSTNKAGCGANNYSVTQFSGTYPLVIPANSSKALSAMGVVSSQWPQVSMIDLPVNQDACKGATITLTYTGTGSGN